MDNHLYKAMRSIFLLQVVYCFFLNLEIYQLILFFKLNCKLIIYLAINTK